jgi:hypothetical protein
VKFGLVKSVQCGGLLLNMLKAVAAEAPAELTSVTSPRYVPL